MHQYYIETDYFLGVKRKLWVFECVSCTVGVGQGLSLGINHQLCESDAKTEARISLESNSMLIVCVDV